MDFETLLQHVNDALPSDSCFKKAILKTLRFEGGFVNDPKDPGGATNWGISIRYLKARGDYDGDGWLDGDIDHDGDIDVSDIKNMTVEEAVGLYKTGFWDKYHYSEIGDCTVAARAFDMTVNMGARNAGKILQRALNDTGCSLAVDGIVGPNTRKQINEVDADTLMAHIRLEQASYYLDLIKRHPSLEKFKNGWLKRAAA